MVGAGGARLGQSAGLVDPREGSIMEHSATMRHAYELVNAGDIDGAPAE
jgi:hypothetical protein